MRKPLLFLLMLASPLMARAEDAYFFTLFSYQAPLNRPKDSHTFATFTKRSLGPDGRSANESFTISWLPKRIWDSGDLRTLGGPEDGRNFPLERTLRLGLQGLRRPQRWGPYQIAPEFFVQARERYRFLESGAARYVVLDGSWREPAGRGLPGGAVNCIHAVSDIAGRLDTGLSRGDSGSEAVLIHFLEGDASRRFVNYPMTHEWLARELGFDDVTRVERIPVRAIETGELKYYSTRDYPNLILGAPPSWLPPPPAAAVTLGRPIPLDRWVPAQPRFDGR